MRVRVFHPLLFPLFPLLSLYASNTGEVPFSAILLPMAVVLALAALSYLLPWALFRRQHTTGVIVSFCWLLFFSFAALHKAADGMLRPHGWQDAGISVVFTVCLLAIASAVVLLARSPRTSEQLTLNLNWIALALIVMPLMQAGWYLIETTPPPVSAVTAGAPSPDAPNIYYFLLDAYTSNDQMQRLYHYDNTPFITELAQRGFTVNPQARSNYHTTSLSMPSIFYLDTIEKVFPTYLLRKNGTRRLPLLAVMNANPVCQTLKQQGYRMVSFSSGFSWPELAHVGECRRPPVTLHVYTQILLKMTPLPTLFPRWYRHLVFTDERTRMQYAFDHLDEVDDRAAPVFVYWHSNGVHDPFVFSADGGMPVADNHKPFTTEEYANGYREQLTYLNGKLLSAIDAILAGAHRPCLIVLQGDHGPYTFSSRARYAVLSAIRTPPGVQLHFTDTPVNTFRVIFNHYFHTAYPLLPDHSYYPAPHPGEILDISEQVRRDGPLPESERQNLRSFFVDTPGDQQPHASPILNE